MIDEGDFDQLRQGLKEYDDTREVIIKRTRDMQRLAKHAVYSLHRSNDQEASAKLGQAEKIAVELLPLIDKEPTLRVGGFSASIEEYAEARIFQTYLQDGRLLAAREVDLATREEYIGGLLDFTGELNRYAVARATAHDVAAVQRCRDLCDGIMDQMLRFDLRNGSLRKKFDALKYTLRKLENLLYELSLMQARLGRKAMDEGEPGMADDDLDAAAD